MQAKDVLPRHVDPRKLAFHNAILEGRVPSDELTRLLDVVEKVHGIIAYLAFKVDEQGRRVVSGTLSADVEFQCQRCLKPVSHSLSSTFDVAVIGEEEEAEQLAAHLDPWVVSGEEGDLYHLVEEEILLSVPLVPMHAEICVDKNFYASGAEETDQSEDNPFSVLKQWQKGPTK